MKQSNAVLLGLALVVVVGGGLAFAMAGGRGKAGNGGGGPAIPVPPPNIPDVTTNWGKTPTALRPMFIAAEEASGVPGTARLLAIFAYRYSKFAADKHDKSMIAALASTLQYENLKAKRPPLSTGAAKLAKEFGRGGLFGLQGPEYIWSGFKDLWAKAPLLSGNPESGLDPRYALFAAAMRLQDVVPMLNQVDSRPELAVGFADPALLSDRNNVAFGITRKAFLDAAKELGIDLSLLPAKFQSTSYKGAMAAYQKLTSLSLPAPADLKI